MSEHIGKCTVEPPAQLASHLRVTPGSLRAWRDGFRGERVMLRIADVI